MSGSGASSAAAPDGRPGTPGEYHGRPTRRLQGAGCWIEVLSEAGPRIVGLGLAGGENLLAETPDLSWDAGHGRYELLGGHRLWFAPESSASSVPDSTGLTLSALGGEGTPRGAAGVRLIGAIELPTGLCREVELQLDPATAAIVVRHIIRNEGSRTLTLAVWPITQLPLGGTAFAALPAPVAGHAMAPNQLLALWPYASWSDERLSLGPGLVSVAARPGPLLKIGCLSSSGAVAYLREGVLFVKRFDPAVASSHPDLGCNLEIYVDQETIELETLGPLASLGPGQSATHDERWELHPVDGASTLEQLVERFGLR